jgi:hypothetical protein
MDVLLKIASAEFHVDSVQAVSFIHPSMGDNLDQVLRDAMRIELDDCPRFAFDLVSREARKCPQEFPGKDLYPS